MPIEITVEISGSGSDRTLTFSESPVRVGRNQLNDITIDDPFISQWHGLIRFGSEGITYSDLGSTNGSIIEGVRLSTNVPNRLSDRSRVLLGRIELAVSMAHEDTGPRKTIGWGHPSSQSRRSREPIAAHNAAAKSGLAKPPTPHPAASQGRAAPPSVNSRSSRRSARPSSACARDMSSSGSRSGSGPSMVGRRSIVHEPLRPCWIISSSRTRQSPL